MFDLTCPACGTPAPAGARRCKECFHSYADAKPKASLAQQFLPVLTALALFSIGLAGTVAWMVAQPVDERSLVDASQRQIQWVRTFKDGRLETRSVAFDDIQKITLHQATGGQSRIEITDKAGEALVIDAAVGKGLAARANEYARMIGKPLETVGDAPKP
ncbi:MAG: hypothetical protein RLZZ383_887 [Pseudomonadota bacterium]|jgi:hypothetical protein